eukprot:scaffold9059_cov108-Isochrysis_galbana.AAC.1
MGTCRELFVKLQLFFLTNDILRDDHLTLDSSSGPTLGASSAVNGGFLSASEESAGVVGGGACSFEQVVSGSREDSRSCVVCVCVSAMVGSCPHGAVSLFTEPYGCNSGCAATLWLLRVRSPGWCDGAMCKALAGSGRVTGQVYCRLRLALRHRWSKWLGSLAHHVKAVNRLPQALT